MSEQSDSLSEYTLLRPKGSTVLHNDVTPSTAVVNDLARSRTVLRPATDLKLAKQITQNRIYESMGKTKIEDKKNEETEIERREMIEDLLKRYIPRNRILRKLVERVELDRSKHEELLIENSYLFYIKMRGDHLVIAQLIMLLQTTELTHQDIGKLINCVLRSVTSSESITIYSPIKDLSIMLKFSNHLEYHEKISMIKDIVDCNDEQNDFEIIEEFRDVEKTHNWFVSHNGSIKEKLVKAIGRNDSFFIDKLNFDHEINNRRWIIKNMMMSHGSILVVNKKYFESKWCCWELEIMLLLQRRFKYAVYPIIIEGDFNDYPIISKIPGKSVSLDEIGILFNCLSPLVGVGEVSKFKKRSCVIS